MTTGASSAPRQQTREHLSDLLAQIEYHRHDRRWRIALRYDSHQNPDHDRPYLQVRFGGDHETPRWSGRKWFLSWHMTDSEVVQTALKAFLAAEEHETREAFLFMGQPIFGPHHNVHDLVRLMTSAQLGVDDRPDGMQGAA